MQTTLTDEREGQDFHEEKTVPSFFPRQKKGRGLASHLINPFRTWDLQLQSERQSKQ